MLEALNDGSWISAVFDSRTDKKREHPTRVRVIEYTVNDGRAATGSYRLITTILDPAYAPATELAAAYAQRWEIETAFDELKTHQRGPRKVLRSGTPELVLQEIWGHLCCHYAIRSLMFDAVATHSHDPDRVSFVTALRISRRSITQQGVFSPSAHWPGKHPHSSLASRGHRVDAQAAPETTHPLEPARHQR